MEIQRAELRDSHQLRFLEKPKARLWAFQARGLVEQHVAAPEIHKKLDDFVAKGKIVLPVYQCISTVMLST